MCAPAPETVSGRASAGQPARAINMVLLWAILGQLFSALLSTQSVAAPWVQVRAAASYDRAHLPMPRSAERIRAAGDLSGGPGECCVLGWVDYDFDVPLTGWYELAVRGSGSQVEFLINPQGGAEVWRTFDSSGNLVDGLDKIGNYWLAAGRNVVRIQRYYWTGFPRLSAVQLRTAPPTSAGSLHLTLGSESAVFRAGACAALIVHSGALAQPTTLTIDIRDPTGRSLGTSELDLPASRALRRDPIGLPCDVEGDFLVSVRDKRAGWLAWRDVRGVGYQVIGRAAPTAVSRSGGPKMANTSLDRHLLREIDLVRTAPDHSSGDTRIVRNAEGGYRESGAVGFTRYQRAPDALRRALPEPDWFAYAFEGLEPQALHEVEVEFPDDAERSVVIALREPAPLAYPVSTGYDTGGEFALSGKPQRQSLLFWPRGGSLRVVLMNVHDGRRAAASRIRLYRRDRPDSPASVPGGRDVLQWYEEGANFHSVVGTPDITRHEWRAQPRRIGAERWVRLARHGGATLIAPTVGIYSFGLYPSRYNRLFSTPEGEDLRHLLLAAEKHGLGVIPELHPRADELDWPYAQGSHPRPNQLLSRSGTTNHFQKDGRTRNVPPHFDPLHPANQDWYVGLVEEMLRLHADSPALRGVSLRLMPWANASLNNFASLDWGYDDATFTRFIADNGIDAPVALRGSAADHPELAAARHAWLLRHARERWIDWRCRRITALYTRLRDTVRAVRPDLLLYTSLFTWQEDAPDAQALREAGIDVEALSALDGLRIIDARGTYGRREPDEASNRRRRQRLLTADALGAGSKGGVLRLSTASYVEATDIIVPPERIGFPAATRRTWSSTAMVPAGHHILERYAVQLARTDALLLGDGGNGYAAGQPLLHDWLRVYRSLPARQFETYPSGDTTVTVRWMEQDGRFVAYVVNSTDDPVSMTLALTDDARPRGLTDDRPLSTTRGGLTILLEPYGLSAFSARTGTRILKSSVRHP